MTGAGVGIRPAQATDFSAVADLLNAAYLTVGIDLGETAATVRERSQESLTVVLDVDGNIAGTLTIAPAGSYYGRMAGPGQMEVSRLAVAPKYQGRGLGMVMVELVAGPCYEQGITSFVGASLDSMAAAQHMYETAGAMPTQIPGVKARTYTLRLTEDDA